MVYEQPSIFIYGLRVDEPVTVLTDLLVSAVCFYAFIRLRSKKHSNKVLFYLRYYFLTMGIATSVGGILGHGFLYALERSVDITMAVSPWKLPAWLISMFSVMLVERAAIEYARPIITRKTGIFFSWLNIVELTTFIIITLITLNFFFVQAHAAYGLLVVVTGFNFYVFIKRKTRGSKIFLIAVFFAAISALVFMNKWGISQWFTHFDISHVLMSVSAYFFYRGAHYVVNDPLLEMK